jgi:excisionase family DNA binding protein
VSAPDPAPTLPPLFVDAREAARLLSISRSEIYNMLAAGRMGSVKHGTRRLIPMGEVHRFAESLTASGVAEQSDTKPSA